jgi:ankyrin repeat protein
MILFNKKKKLLSALTNGDIEAVKHLIDIGANIRARYFEEENTTFMIAATLGHIEIAQLILKHGIDINAVNNKGQTALHIAICTSPNPIDIVKFLLQAGADLNIKDKVFEQTPLHYCAWLFPNVEVMKILLDHNADINANDISSLTSLHHAADQCHRTGNQGLDMVKLLLEYGADLNVKTENGRTALDIAQAGQHSEIVNLLSDAKKKNLGLFERSEVAARRSGNQDFSVNVVDKLKALRIEFSELPKKYPNSATIVGHGAEAGKKVIHVICDVCDDAIDALKSGKGVEGFPITKKQISDGLKRLIIDAKSDLGVIAMQLNTHGVQLYQECIERLDAIANDIG